MDAFQIHQHMQTVEDRYDYVAVQRNTGTL